MTIQYAGQVFQPDHVTSRFILIIGAGDVKEEVANSARSHLYGALKKATSTTAATINAMETDETPPPILPDFLLMLKYVLEKCALRVKSSKHRVDLGGVHVCFLLIFLFRIYTHYGI